MPAPGVEALVGDKGTIHGFSEDKLGVRMPEGGKGPASSVCLP